jgi:hypothetical protein
VYILSFYIHFRANIIILQIDITMA